MSRADTAAVAEPQTVTQPAMALRAAYREHLVALMAKDPRVVCLDSDTGLFMGVDFGPAADRYLNMGIGEQNLIGVAAGLAADGLIPYVNTMAAFACSRAAEAIKVDVAYSGLPVRIAATHAGVSAGHYGPTHHALEDLATMLALPNMTVLVPGDQAGLISLLDQVPQVAGPVYLRLGRGPQPELPPADSPVVLGRLQVLMDGADVVFVATGPLPTWACLGAAAQLRGHGVDAGVLHAHTLRPFDEQRMLARTASARLVVVVEEHWRHGGLGSLVAGLLAERSPRRVKRVGLPDSFVDVAGSQEELLARAGIVDSHLAASVLAEFSQHGAGGRA